MLSAIVKEHQSKQTARKERQGETYFWSINWVELQTTTLNIILQSKRERKLYKLQTT